MPALSDDGANVICTLSSDIPTDHLLTATLNNVDTEEGTGKIGHFLDLHKTPKFNLWGGIDLLHIALHPRSTHVSGLLPKLLVAV